MYKQLLQFKTFLLVCLLAMVGTNASWGETVTLTSQQIKAGSGSSTYSTCSATDGGGNEWKAYAIKNQHSKATSDYNFWQIKKYASSTAYYVQVPELGSKITQLKITVSGTSNPRTGGNNTATLYFSSSNNTSATGTGVVSGTGDKEVTIDCSSLNLNTGYITASGAVRIWDIEVTYTASGTPTPSTYTVTYAANGGAGTMTDTQSPYEKGEEVTLLTNTFTAPEGKLWSSWAVTDASDNVVTVTDGKFTMPASNVTVTAQWINDPSAPTYVWTETSITDLTENDVFVIVGTNSTYNYALYNGNGTSSAPTASSVTINDENEINVTKTFPVSNEYQWTIKGDATNGYTFYPYGDTAKWLYCTNSNNGVRVGTNDDKTFILSDNHLQHKGTSRYLAVYPATPDWRCYSNTSTQNTTIKFYKKVNGNQPKLTSSDVNLVYDATSGSVSYTLVNPVSGGVVTATSSENWLTVGTIDENSVALSCEANSAATERVAEVTLTYTYNTNETVTKTVTVTQAANPDATMTIAEVRAQSTGTTVKTTGVVTSVNGKTAYIQDSNAAIVVYDSSTNLSCVVGDEITVEGTLSAFNGLLEITSPTVTVESQNNTVTPEVMTIAQVNASTKQGWLVKIENATVTAIDNQNTTIAQGENSIIVHGISSEVEYSVNDVLTLTGNIGCYNTVQIANPTDVVVAENEDPVINVSTTSIEVDAAGTSGTISVTYDNITEVLAEVQFFESDGTTAATCDWIEAEINQANNVEYTVAANTTTESRIAYLKVYALDDDANDVYSDLIVITQDAPVVDYASLPFDYDGDGTGTLPSGLTQHGLGKYNSSPKMKFDGTGDYLVLKLDEEPGALSYDIKGNSFSEGTFTVQTSSNGESFTDLATYTELGETQNEFLGSIPAGTRYIKWVYTEKSLGNVALGNIRVAKPITAKINAYGYGTFASTSKVMFSAEDENLTAWQVKGVDETEITFEQVTGNVAEGTGLLLKGSEGTVTVAAANEGVDISATNKLVGITSATTVVEGEYYGLSGSKFVKVNPGTVPAGKALLPASVVGNSNGVRALTFVFVDPTTGISETQTVSAEQFGEIFNLAGQRISQPQKGVNIINGKKVLVK